MPAPATEIRWDWIDAHGMDDGASFIRRHSESHRGYTLVELLVALSILLIGTATLWYSLQGAARASSSNKLHHLANQLARADIERIMAGGVAILDTSYVVAEGAGRSLRVTRRVLTNRPEQASGGFSFLPDENPDRQHLPSEIRVEVREDGVAKGIFSRDEERVLAAFSALVPEHVWR